MVEWKKKRESAIVIKQTRESENKGGKERKGGREGERKKRGKGRKGKGGGRGRTGDRGGSGEERARETDLLDKRFFEGGHCNALQHTAAHFLDERLF